MLEGGAAGIVDMRSVRPFDKRGFRSAFRWWVPERAGQELGFARLGHRQQHLGQQVPGALVGLSWANNKVNTTGFETIGWTNAGLGHPKLQCPRSSTGGGNWTIPGNVPANAGSGLRRMTSSTRPSCSPRTPAPASPKSTTA